MDPDTYYLIGAGTTTRGIMQMLGLKNTLIGVDLIKNRELVANDLYGDKILDYIRGKKTKLVVTVTGGQGFLFWSWKPADYAGGDPGRLAGRIL